MKLHQSIQTKQTTKLFNNKYKYKIVLVLRSASWFRGCNFDLVENYIAEQDKSDADPWFIKLNPYEKQYTIQLCNTLKNLKITN